MMHGGSPSTVSTATVLLWVVSFVGFAGLLAIARFGYQRYKRLRERVVEAWGDLFGRDAVMHPNLPSEILVPATPGVGFRLTTIERQQTETSETLQNIAELIAEIARVHRRIDDEIEQRKALAELVDQHLSEEVAIRRLEHEEQLKMWSAIEAVANADPATYRDDPQL